MAVMLDILNVHISQTELRDLVFVQIYVHIYTLMRIRYNMLSECACKL